MSSPPREAKSAAPLVIGYFARDLFIGVRLAETVARLRYLARPICPTDAVDGIALLLVDLSAPVAQWEPLVVAASGAGTPTLAFGSHMDQARWQTARQAGATRIVANSQLVEHLPELIERLLHPGRQVKDEA